MICARLCFAALFPMVGVCAWADLATLRAFWEDRQSIATDATINRYLPSDGSERELVAVDSASFAWSDGLWRIELAQEDGDYAINGNSGPFRWSVKSSPDNNYGTVHERETPSMSVTRVPDPFYSSFMINGHPIWEFQVATRDTLLEVVPFNPDDGPGFRGGGPPEDGNNSVPERLPVLESVQLFVPDSSSPAHLESYDLVVFNFGKPTHGIMLDEETGGAFGRIDSLHQTRGTVKWSLTIEERDPTSLTPLVTRYDQYNKAGEWWSGYTAEVVALDLNPSFDPAFFQPDFSEVDRIYDSILHETIEMSESAARKRASGYAASTKIDLGTIELDRASSEN